MGRKRTIVRRGVLGFAALSLFLPLASCVDINDAKVQVHPPGEVDPYQRNVLDKCAPHIYPHRLIVAQTGSSSALVQAGSQVATNQADFDRFWSYVTFDPAEQVSSQPVTGKPDINWDQQMAYFLVVPSANSCEKSKPMPDEMTTDCYSITIPLLRYTEGKDCQPSTFFPVYIYTMSKVTLPFEGKWFYPTPTPTATEAPKPTATPTPLPKPAPKKGGVTGGIDT